MPFILSSYSVDTVLSTCSEIDLSSREELFCESQIVLRFCVILFCRWIVSSCRCFSFFAASWIFSWEIIKMRTINVKIISKRILVASGLKSDRTIVILNLFYTKKEPCTRQSSFINLTLCIQHFFAPSAFSALRAF